MGTMRRPTLHITTRGEQRWRVRYRDVKDRQASETFKTERNAKQFSRWLADFGVAEALRQLESMQTDEAKAHTVESWCLDHIEHLTGVTAGTRRRYRGYVTNDLGALRKLALDSVTPRTISLWVRALEDAGASGKTIKNKHGFLSSVMASAVRSGLITSNPCKGTKLPRSITEPMVFLTHDEYTRFLGCFQPRWIPFVEVLFGTGLRWGEITALRCGDVDLEAHTITITRAWKEGDGTPELGPTKSRRSRRTISIAAETATILGTVIGDHSPAAWLFTNSRSTPVRGSTFHAHVWQPAVRLANGEPVQSGRKRMARNYPPPLDPPLGKRPRIHDARHTCASWLLGAGIPINYVQAHLGHESITTTVDRYGHVMPAARLAVSQALSAALSASRPQLLP